MPCLIRLIPNTDICLIPDRKGQWLDGERVFFFFLFSWKDIWNVSPSALEVVIVSQGQGTRDGFILMWKDQASMLVVGADPMFLISVAWIHRVVSEGGLLYV